MAAITEDYISFETAKLLKEKGFSLPSTNFEDWLCCMYDENGNIQWGCYHSDYYARVTLQMAMKWLREVHLILYIIYHSFKSGELRFSWRVYKLEQNKKHYVEELPRIGEYYKDSDESFTTYKEAEESLIKYCLENLIK